MLRVHAARRLGAFTLDVAFDVPTGSTLALVGESGSGKTSILRMLAGLLTPDHGRVELDDSVYFDRAGVVDVPAWRRSVGYVAQDYALFPHLTVARNVGFGLRAAGVPADAASRRVADALARFDVADLADRRPGALSGGQQQRVALARALVLEPRLLLLDEPLSALDPQTRREVRGELKRLLTGLPCVTLYVTHSPAEAIVFGDRLAVVAAGGIAQCDTAEALLRQPRTSYVAEFMGVNLLRGEIRRREPGELVRVAAGGGELFIPDPGGDGELFLVVDPREIVLSRSPLHGSAQNQLVGAIEEIVPEPPAGERLRVSLATHPPIVAEVTRAAAAAMNLAPGVIVYAAFKASGVRTYR